MSRNKKASVEPVRPVLPFFYAMSLGITLIGQRGKFVRTSLGKMED